MSKLLRSEVRKSSFAVIGVIVRPGVSVVYLTEQLLYAEGINPLYSGCPSAKVMISGGRYDYTFDNHRRLTKAAYTPKTSGSSEDFSVEYAYDAVANPQYVKRKGIINVSATGKESFGILDELGYSYEGNQLTDITQLNQGVDFYGRTGYAPTSGRYTWNEAGLLNSDSSRGILSTTYNHLGLPARQSIKTNSSMAMTVFYSYSADGTLLSVGSGTTRYYSGSRIFEGNALEYSYFPGGYFDAAGAAHYTHTDYQGSIIAVTDSTGKVIQKVDYYPYGEPWREPSGQPMLFSGKERTSLADYRFGPRSLISVALLWDAPDQLAGQFRHLSPYSYCAGNPIFFSDPTGRVLEIARTISIEGLLKFIENLAELTYDMVSVSIDLESNENYTVNLTSTKGGSKTTGTKLLRKIVEQKKKVTLDFNNSSGVKHSKKVNDNENWNQPFQNGNSFVNLSDEQERIVNVYNADGDIEQESSPLFIGLGHELIHGLHTLNDDKQKGKVVDRINNRFVNLEELYVIGILGDNELTENELRKEHGLPLRATHAITNKK